MARPKKCKMYFHGVCTQIDMGVFESISKAKKYAKRCWGGGYTIITL